MGRVKVRFPWDRTQKPDDDVSHWVPVLQDNTGQAGAIPRVDWEVLCGFADGDPDRPVAVGRLYNARDPFPTQLPEGKTKSALRSLSSPGRDGENAIWIDDKAGSELLSVVAEKDQTIEVENDRSEKVVGDEKTTILKDETLTIGRTRDTRVQDEHNATVSGNQTISVGGSHQLEVGAGSRVEVDGDRSLSIGSLHFRRIGGKDDVAVKGSLSELIGAAVVEASLKKNERAAGVIGTLTVGGAIVELSLKGKAEQTEMLRLENVFGSHVSTALGEQARTLKLTRASTHLALTMTSFLGDLTLEAKGELCPTMTIDVKGSGKLAAKELVLSSGEHSVTITGDKIAVDSKADVVFEGIEGGVATLLAKGATIDKA
jgi:type VI secretion system secreted protein VgrG